jgi:hypothetical protein
VEVARSQGNMSKPANVHQDWNPLHPQQPEFLDEELYVVGMAFDGEELVVSVAFGAPERNRLDLAFSLPIAILQMNESHRMRTWESEHVLGPLSTVENSDWLRWIRAEAGGVLDDQSILHYAIYSAEECIDVATEHAPVVTMIG